jgi:type 1 fimbriae regulatory protein FimB
LPATGTACAIGMRRDQLDVKRSRLCVKRLEGSLSAEQPILRGVARHQALSRHPRPSGRHSSPARPSIISCGSLARLQSSVASGRTCCAISCGYYLADQGTDLRTMQDYLRHRDPKLTAHYTRVAGHRIEGLWR